MATSFRELRTVQTEADLKVLILGLLDGFGFEVTAWGDFDFPMRMVTAFARVLASAWLLVNMIAAGGYGDTAAELRDERWLDIWAWDRYRLSRLAERAAVGALRISDPTGQGPFSIPVGGLIVGTDDGLNFQTTEIVTLPAFGTVSVAAAAAGAGSAYNIPSNTALRLITDFPGLVVENPPQAGTQSWLTTSGADRERNIPFYGRCLLQWALLSVATPRDFYAAKIMASVQTITKVGVDDENPLGPGTAECICATGAGPASGADIVLANSVLTRIRSVGGGKTQARAAIARGVHVGGVAYVQAAKVAAVRAEVARLLGELQVALPLGGTVYAAELIRIVKSQDGVRNFVPAGFADLTAAIDEVITLYHEITYVAE